MRAKQQPHQLPLQISLADSARLQLDRDTWEAYARDQQDRANALAEENTKLREALKAEQTRMLDLERELIFTQTLARTWEVQVQLWRRDSAQAPRATRDKDTLTQLLKLCHPDRWQNQPAEKLAHELSVVLNDLRSRRLGVV